MSVWLGLSLVAMLLPDSISQKVFNKKIAWLFAGHAMYSWWRNRALRKENTGRFLGEKEVKELLSPRHRGLLLDGKELRLTEDASFRNVAVIATTGAGKTAGYILPNLLGIERGSIIATDPSGSLYARTSGDLQRRGFRVYQLNPLELSASIGYNPLSFARTVPEMQEVAHILVRTANREQWSKNRSLLASGGRRDHRDTHQVPEEPSRASTLRQPCQPAIPLADLWRWAVTHAIRGSECP